MESDAASDWDFVLNLSADLGLVLIIGRDLEGELEAEVEVDREGRLDFLPRLSADLD
jgi:hypothetical protein